MYYHSGVSSCYEKLAFPGFSFVSRKLTLTTIVRLNVFQHWYNIILVCLVGMRLALLGLKFVDGKLSLNVYYGET